MPTRAILKGITELKWSITEHRGQYLVWNGKRTLKSGFFKATV